MRLPAVEYIGGEPFRVERDGDQVYIEHPAWPLVGVGRSLMAARADLLVDIKALAVALRDDDAAALSPDALKMRTFILRCVARST